MAVQRRKTASSDWVQQVQQQGAPLKTLGRLSWGACLLVLLGCSTSQSCEASVSSSTSQEGLPPPQIQTTAASPKKADAAPSVASEEIDYGKLHAGRAGAALLGKAAEGANLQLLDGTSSDLSEVLGRKPVYLKFWATWCAPCLEQMPHLNETYEKYRDQIAVYAVNLGLNDSLDAVKEVQKEKKLAMPIAVDAEGTIAQKYHVTVTPMHVLIDQQGVIRYVGHHADTELDEAIRLIASGKEESKGRSNPQPSNSESDATQLRLELHDGKHSNQAIAINFFATWTDWYLEETRPEMSKASLQHTRRLEELKKSHPDIYWVSVASPVWTQNQDLDEYLERLKASGPLGIDEDSRWFEHYRVRDLPTTIFFAKGGAEVARARTAKELDTALATLLAKQR